MIAQDTLSGKILNRLDRPVAVWGYGCSGFGAAALLAARGVDAVVYDAEVPEADRSHFGSAEAGEHDLVVYSPGFAPDHPWFAVASAAGCECLGEIDFASLFWDGPVIAITGTNGKTTLTELLTCALGRAGYPAVAAGNIGAAFSRMASCIRNEDTFAVCEVSSFQAQSLRLLAPDWTLWTNFAEDHLERHGSMRVYFEAKHNLVARTPSGHSLFGPSVLAYSDAHDHVLDPAGLADRLPDGYDVSVAGTPFATDPQRENLILAVALWRRLGLGDEVLQETLRSFRIGDHRLRKIATVAGVEYWNDSKATNFHACESALARFERPVVWIGGGKSKGGDLAAFADRLLPRIRQAILLGETGPALSRLLTERGMAARLVADLDHAVRMAMETAEPGDRVVLSPAFSSLDMFGGYDDRGRAFAEAVHLLSAEPVPI
jgi:UDP-N-acetylmuramoylalanine--D-glutamate ligase